MVATNTTKSVVVRYSDFGAKGDGKTDDLNAVVAAHEHANKHNLSVEADTGATYFLGGRANIVKIQTNTSFGNATFIIDDRKVEARGKPVFQIDSTLKKKEAEGITTMKKGQESLGVTLDQTSLVITINDEKKQYIRKGNNLNDGASQRDILLVDADGRIHPDYPVLWNFDKVTKTTIIPIDPEPLSISGGTFITITNQAPSKYTYYERGIQILRSNVTIDGLTHIIEGEGETGAPYNGFIVVNNSYNVTIQNCKLSGRKTYNTIGRAGRPVDMGSYDLSLHSSLQILIQNCIQINDIMDRSRWGIMASNYCKHVNYDGCTLSRYDAHKGVYNGTIRNSTIGHAGINLIGMGTFLLENSTVKSSRLLSLRPDYGGTWEGDVIIRNTTFSPINSGAINLILGNNTQDHDFGYDCCLPNTVLIENLMIDDSNLHSKKSPAAFNLFTDFNPKCKARDYQGKYPLHLPQQIRAKNVTMKSSGNPVKLNVSSNQAMFHTVKLIDLTGKGEETNCQK